MNKRIYITRQIPEIGISMLKEKGYDVVIGTDTKPVKKKKLISILKKAEKKGQGYDALLTLLTDQIDTEVYNAGISLKVVSNYAIGYDNIDVKTAQERGIIITNAPGNYIDTIAEHVVALTLSLSARIVEADRFMRQGKFNGWNPMIFIGTDLHNKTIGLIGAGHIGEKAAMHFAKGMNMEVIYTDMHANESLEKECGAVKVTQDELLAQADVVSLHVPLLPSTRHMVDESFLKKMKKTAYLINTSRGAVIDEAVLVKALQERWIKGAALDVYEFEPKLARGLNKLDNVVLTPHIASASEYARNEMARVAAQNIIDVFEKKTPVGNVTV